MDIQLLNMIIHLNIYNYHYQLIHKYQMNNFINIHNYYLISHNILQYFLYHMKMHMYYLYFRMQSSLLDLLNDLDIYQHINLFHYISELYYLMLMVSHQNMKLYIIYYYQHIQISHYYLQNSYQHIFYVQEQLVMLMRRNQDKYLHNYILINIYLDSILHSIIHHHNIQLNSNNLHTLQMVKNMMKHINKQLHQHLIIIYILYSFHRLIIMRNNYNIIHLLYYIFQHINNNLQNLIIHKLSYLNYNNLHSLFSLHLIYMVNKHLYMSLLNYLHIILDYMK